MDVAPKRLQVIYVTQFPEKGAKQGIMVLMLWECLQRELGSESRVVHVKTLAKDEVRWCNVVCDQVYK